jgi:hypothetical protein
MNSIGGLFLYSNLSGGGRELTIGQHGFLCRPKGQIVPENHLLPVLAVATMNANTILQYLFFLFQSPFHIN